MIYPTSDNRLVHKRSIKLGGCSTYQVIVRMTRDIPGAAFPTRHNGRGLSSNICLFSCAHDVASRTATHVIPGFRANKLPDLHLRVRQNLADDLTPDVTHRLRDCVSSERLAGLVVGLAAFGRIGEASRHWST